jgi:hypothetical protein
MSQLNMTEVTGTAKQVGQGLTQKTFKYDALGSLVDIVTNTAGKQRVQLFRSSITNARDRSSRVSCCTESDRWRRWWKHRRR